MAMTNRQNIKLDSFILSTIEDLVPQDHLVRKIEECIDFTFIYPKVNDLYSSFGRPSIDPVVLFKLVFINIIFGYNSMRRTCDEVTVNLAYRWFLGIDINEKVPNYSTWSQNYIRRYCDSNVFEEIFNEIISQAMKYQFINVESVFGDSTHQKANANKRKSENKEVELVAKKYEEDLLKEINEDREMCGKKIYKTLTKKEIVFDETTGEEKEVVATKNIKVSTVDSEAGNYHKGEKEQCFAYSHQTFSDGNGFVLSVTTVPGNIHDSSSFFDAYHVLNEKFQNQIKNVCLDAGYKTPAICRSIILNDQSPILPYKRPMTKKGYFKKYEYIYDELYDFYICPNEETLYYTTTNREGYREYASDPKVCVNCPHLKQCTSSKNHKKIITRHVWQDYVEIAENIRYTNDWKVIYPKRKETIERVFADCKENNGLRFTRYKGLKKNQNNAWLIFGCHNLKKMALWNDKSRSTNNSIRNYLSKLFKLVSIIEKNTRFQIETGILSTV